MSLRQRLIEGIFTPQAVGMNVYKQRKAAEAARARAEAEAEAQDATAAAAAVTPSPRDFLGPGEPVDRDDDDDDDDMFVPAPKVIIDRLQQNRQTANKTTPTHQFYYPESLLLALKQNMHGHPHPDMNVFVLVRLVGEEVEDICVFDRLTDATARAVYAMMHEHPEAFATATSAATTTVRAVDLIGQLGVQPPTLTDPTAASSTDSQEMVWRSIQQEDIEEGEGEDETAYVYQGDWKVSATTASTCCLKLETRRSNGTSSVKISVHRTKKRR
ncbi:hypothetical protein F5Y17DRAFT_413392 [Xylariaceae sp. FL0594]|nr:hypothetical protein F5Y17DRAFT_413392 [Xylariaceae sp. FL0594]